ncbi:hypothetical protein B9Z55_023898 [Caenorhabditis nigoni]|nr:hypothetical protein B9Z55_023898 [Caenorhabditis nigoni]
MSDEEEVDTLEEQSKTDDKLQRRGSFIRRTWNSTSAKVRGRSLTCVEERDECRRENNSDDAKSLSPDRSPNDHNFLCPDDNGGVYGAGPTHSAIKKTNVRRAASFTFSPKQSSSSKSSLREEKKRFL